MVARVLAAAVSAEARFALPGFFVLAAAVSAEACFAWPGFFTSVDSILTTLLLLLVSLVSLEGSACDAHSVMEQAKNFRSSPASESSWMMAASKKKCREEDGVAVSPVAVFL